MLYGSEKIQKDVIAAVREYAEKNDILLVFGSMVGSVSKGINYVNSDYDTRFLYLRKDFPESICVPKDMEEDELKKRIYPDDNRIWEWIPLWELSSFLQFLAIPSFKNDFSVGLYNIVGWTFQSPYQWDPFGIRNKIMSLVDSIFIKEYEIEYHLKEIEKFNSSNTEKMVVAKSYLGALHAAMTIDWSISHESQPPVYYETLLACCCDRELENTAKRIFMEARQEAVRRSNFKLEGAVAIGELGSLHFKIFTQRYDVIDQYITQKYQEGKAAVDGFRISDERIENCQARIQQMYDIIWSSINVK